MDGQVFSTAKTGFVVTSPSAFERKIVPIAVDNSDHAAIALYATESKIYPRGVTGFFSNIRWITVWLTQIIFYGFPWLEWGQRQAVLFDLGARRFFVFGLVLYPQDLVYLTAMLVIAALTLFLFTAVAGRLWCGYACPQTVYTEIFLWIEKKVCGDRSARMRLDAGPWTLNRYTRKVTKHVLWGVFSLWTGFTFVGYFTSIRELTLDVWQLNPTTWETFWILFYALATYGNAGYLREQICKHMCPYARFQSAMFDKDTLVVAYDKERGEPRGARSRKSDPLSLNLGACVDCNLCFQVCPTGIDIRHGLQYECIGCGACADVCNTVMDKMGYARGLVKYSTENAVEKKWTKSQIWHRVFRPRVLVYTSILAGILFAVIFNLVTRTPFKVDVVPDRGVVRVVEAGNIENIYRMQVMNAMESTQKFSVSVSGLPGIQITSENKLAVESTQSRWLAIRVQLPAETSAPGSYAIYFQVSALDSPGQVIEKSVFRVPN